LVQTTLLAVLNIQSTLIDTNSKKLLEKPIIKKKITGKFRRIKKNPFSPFFFFLKSYLRFHQSNDFDGIDNLTSSDEKETQISHHKLWIKQIGRQMKCDVE